MSKSMVSLVRDWVIGPVGQGLFVPNIEYRPGYQQTAAPIQGGVLHGGRLGSGLGWCRMGG